MNEANDSKFVITKLNIVHDQSNGNYGAGNENIYNTEVLKSIHPARRRRGDVAVTSLDTP